MDNALESFLVAGKQRVDNELKVWFEEQRHRFTHFSTHYQEMLTLLEALVLRGGKRSRPLLVQLAATMTTPPPPEVLVRLSLYPELLHLFVLIHDDIADNDQLRYGGPTLELEFLRRAAELTHPGARFGIGSALVAGDLLHVLANDLLWSLPLELATLQKIHRAMQFSLASVVDGWYTHQLQNGMRISEVGEAEYLAGLDQVSASYSFQGPLAIGCIAGQAPSTLYDQLQHYGLLVGRAYQIQDDWMSLYGDDQAMGKPVGNDIREGKKTLFVLKAYQTGSDATKALLDTHLGTEVPPKLMRTITEAISESGAEQATLEFAKSQINKARELVAAMAIEDQHKTILYSLADYTLTRNH